MFTELEKYYQTKKEIVGSAQSDYFKVKENQIITETALHSLGNTQRMINNLLEDNILIQVNKPENDEKVVYKSKINNQKNIKSTNTKIDINEKIINKPLLFLPQTDKCLVSDFIQEFCKIIKGCETIFYRQADDNVVEFVNHSLKVITPARMISLIEEHATPVIEVWNDKSRMYDIKNKTCNEQTCKVLLENPTFRETLYCIKRTLLTPIPILDEGKLHAPKRGYNKDLYLYLDNDAPEIHKEIPIQEAKISLIKLYEEFCFKNPEDLMRAITGLLTPFCRGLYKEWNTRTPIYVSFANRERAGKDYLASIRGTIIDGESIEQPPISTGNKGEGNNEELRKKIMSAFLEGRKILHFANNKGHINNSVLEQVSTAKVFSDRLLGKNKLVKFDNDLEFSLSGNMGCTMTPDLTNRSCVMELHLSIENANDRKFNKPNLQEDILNKRSYYLSCLYSLVNNWVEKGAKRSEVAFASFPEWAAVIGGIIESVEWNNPNKVKSQVFSSLDPEAEDMRNTFEAVYEEYPEQWITKTSFKQVISENDLFSHLDLANNMGDHKKLGIMLKKYVGRELGGITLKGDGNKRADREKVFLTKERVDSFVLSDFYEELKENE